MIDSLSYLLLISVGTALVGGAVDFVMGDRAPDDNHFLTPPEIARRLRVSVSKILAHIRSGELVAVDMANAECERPRFKVDPIELAIFLNRRSTRPAPKASRRRKKQNEEIIEYF